MKYSAVILLLFLAPAAALGLRIEGRALNRNSKLAVSEGFARLKAGGKITATAPLDDSGRFVLDNLEKGDFSVEIVSLGYYQESRDITLDRDITLTFYMTPNAQYNLGEVEVVGDRDKSSVSKNIVDKQTRQSSVTTITGDPVAVLNAMPGVKNAAGGGFGGLLGRDRDAAGYSVRGGSGLENMALLDGSLIDHPYHAIYPDSVFIDELVDDLSIFKGVIPPRYGQAMSSVLDVRLIDGSEGLHGKLNLGLLNLYLTLDGATADGRWSFCGGIRRTQYDLVGTIMLNLIEPQVDTTTISLPYYLDSQGKVQYKDSNDLLELTWFFSDEPTSIYLVGSNLASVGGGSNQGYTSAVQNLSISAQNNDPEASLDLRWKHSFDAGLSLDQYVQGTYSFYHQEFYFTNGASNAISSYEDSQEHNLRYKALLNVSVLSNIVLRPGLEALLYPALVFTNVFYRLNTNTNGQLETTAVQNNGYSGVLGVYSGFLECESAFFDNRFSVLGGLRLNYFDYDGAFTLDPRVTVQYEFIPGARAYGACGYMSQFPTDPVILAALTNDRSAVGVPGCWQYVLGGQWKALASSLLTVEGYYKDYQNEVSRTTDTTTTYVTTGGLKRVYGYEVFWTQKPGGFPVYGWIGLGGDYVWQYDAVSQNGNGRTSARSPTNQWYPGSDGIDFKLDITAIWDLNKNWSFTAEFNVVTGNRYTPITGSTVQTVGTNTVYTPVYGDYNSASLPAYHTLNLKAENKGQILGIPYGLYIQAQNVYNDLQVSGYSYSRDYSTKTEQKALLGIIPSVGFWIEW